MHLVSSHNGGDANSCQWTNCGDAQNVRTSHLSLHLRIHNHKLGLEVDHGDEEEDDAGLGNSVGQPGQEHLDENDVDEEEVYSGTGSGFGNGRKANAQDLGADITRDGADGSGKRRIKGYVVEKEDGSYDHLNVIVPRDDMKRFLTGSFTISLTMENDDSAEVDLVAGEKI